MPMAPDVDFTRPYIYRSDEIVRLLRAAAALEPAGHPSAGSSDPAPFALVSALHGYLANGARWRFVSPLGAGIHFGVKSCLSLSSPRDSLSRSSVSQVRPLLSVPWSEFASQPGAPHDLLVRDNLANRV
jgi:hypothetical protein